MRLPFGRFFGQIASSPSFPRRAGLAVLCLVLAAVLEGAFAPAACAAEGGDWPAYDLHPQGPASHRIERGPGGYLSLGKLIFLWVLLLAWVKTSDWASQDCLLMRQNYVVWNGVIYGVFAFFFLLALLIPAFPIGATLLVLAYATPLGTYIFLRNKAVEPHQRVLTKQHLRYFFASKMGKVGVKVETEAKADYDKGAQVDFIAQGAASDRDNGANLLLARQSPGYVPAKGLIADLVDRRGEAAILDYSAEAVAVRYQIDGVIHAVEPRERESGDLMLAVMKKLAALDPAERRKKQSGTFAAKYQNKKYAVQLVSQGTETGERVIVKADAGSVDFKTFEQLGMREKLRQQVEEILGGNTGLILFSAMPAGGLTTLVDVALIETDRLMRHFVAVEDAGKRERDLENVDVTTYDGAAGETPASVLPKLIRSYPDVIVVRDLPDLETVKILCEQVTEENRLVISSIRSKEAPEALLRVLMLKVAPKLFAQAITLVVNQRLVRKLCPACKVAFEPAPDLLQKLGLPPGKVPALYREPKPEERAEQKKPCETCQNIGYRGRTAIFEVLKVDDKVREVLVKQPKLELLKKAAKLAGMRSLQEEGILLVAKGETSLPELMRVLKQ